MEHNDRRIKRTKKALREALTTLMMKKNFKDITIKELTDLADVNRGTFYLHYLDIYDLLEKIEQEMFEQFRSVIDKYSIEELTQNPYPLFIEIYQFISNNSDMCIVLLSENGDIAFLEKLKNIVRHKGLKDWMYIRKDTKEADHTNYEYFYAFIVSGCIGLISSWLENNRRESPEEMAKLTMELLLSGIRS